MEPPDAPTSDVTAVLQEWSAGNAAALSRLMPLVYDQLRSLARAHLLRERADHTLQPTALVHEAYLRLVNQSQVNWQSRAHFFSLAARMMRRILIDHARSRRSERRGAGVTKLSLDAVEIAPAENGADLLALDAALEKLAVGYPRQGNVVELKFFGGLETAEIAEALQVSEKTVLRDWTFAKLWLCREIDADLQAHGAGAN